MDLNSDLGEGFGIWRLGDDEALLGIVTSANVACGFHAGDPSTMRGVACRSGLAGSRGGVCSRGWDARGVREAARRPLQRDRAPRGAGAGRGRRSARVRRVAGAGAARLETARSRSCRRTARREEAFADRGYTPEGTLVPRSQPNALLTDTAAVVERARRLAESGEIVAVDGTVISTSAESLCVHGDTPGAVEHAKAVRAALGSVASFVG